MKPRIPVRRAILALVVFALVLGAALYWRFRSPSATRRDCVAKMEQVWWSGWSYALEYSFESNTVFRAEAHPEYFLHGNVPRCPLGNKEYAPFTLADGPKCPNCPEVHRGARSRWQLEEEWEAETPKARN